MKNLQESSNILKSFNENKKGKTLKTNSTKETLNFEDKENKYQKIAENRIKDISVLYL